MADIDMNLFGELQGLWSSKNWVFQTEEAKATAFNNPCAMFALLSPPQQQLVLRLTQSYSLQFKGPASIVFCKAMLPPFL